MDILNEVINRILGTVSVIDYLVLSVFILIGITLSIRIDTYKRDKTSDATPYHFDIAFFILDNIKRLIKSFVTIFLVIRFGEDITGKALTEWGAVLLGLGFDQIGVILNEKLDKFRQLIRDKFKDT